MDVVMRRLEDDVRLPLLPEGNEELEDVLPAIGKSSDVEVVDGELLHFDAELACRLAHLAGERVRLEPRRKRARRDRERDVTHLAAALDETRHRPAAAELAVIRVRREHERALPGLDHRAIPTSA